MIELTTRNNHKYIFEQCYKLAMSNENYHSVADMLWLADFLIENFGEGYFHYEYIEHDDSEDDSLTVFARMRLGLSVIDMKIIPNWSEVSIQQIIDGEVKLFQDHLDFLGKKEESQSTLTDFIVKVWAEENVRDRS